MFVNGYDQNRISYYNLTTKFDVSTAFIKECHHLQVDVIMILLEWTSVMMVQKFILQNQNDKIYEYDLPSI